MSQIYNIENNKKSKSSLIQVRLDEKTKSELEQVLNILGLTTSQAVLMYVKQIVLKKKIPFELSATADYEDGELSKEEFRRLTGYLVTQLDEGEKIPEFNENNARPFKY